MHKKLYFVETSLSPVPPESEDAIYNHLSDTLVVNGRFYIGISGRKFEKLNNFLREKGRCHQITTLSDGEILFFLFGRLDERHTKKVRRASEFSPQKS